MSTHHHPTFDEMITILKERQIRMTPQRRAILAYMMNSHHHPTVEEIYQDLLPDWPSLSLATVYNNLHVLVDEGIIIEMKFSDVTSRYDFMGHRHHHICCEHCNKICDFHFDDLPDISHPVHEQTGFLVTETRLEVYGICPNCQAKLKSTSV